MDFINIIGFTDKRAPCLREITEELQRSFSTGSMIRDGYSNAGQIPSSCCVLLGRVISSKMKSTQGKNKRRASLEVSVKQVSMLLGSGKAVFAVQVMNPHPLGAFRRS